MSEFYASSLRHRPPFLFVDEKLCAQVPNGVWVQAKFEASNPYLTGEIIPRPLLIEALAQSMALIKNNESVKRGVLAVIKNFKFLRDVQKAESIYLYSALLVRRGKFLFHEAKVFVKSEANVGPWSWPPSAHQLQEICHGELILAQPEFTS